MLIIHTASLYYWFDDYESHLDDRIHVALDAGLDGVEISNGPSILTWQPSPETVERLKNKIVTIHAEIGWGYDLFTWIEAINKLPLNFTNIIFHPDELTTEELTSLNGISRYPVSLENMDSRRQNWRNESEMTPYLSNGLGFTYDTAHAEENGKINFSFNPIETHLSLANSEDYYKEWGYTTCHALTQFRPDNFPYVPSASPLVTLEGLVPPDMAILKEEIKFVKRHI